jgi:hypothetical protein
MKKKKRFPRSLRTKTPIGFIVQKVRLLKDKKRIDDGREIELIER